MENMIQIKNITSLIKFVFILFIRERTANYILAVYVNCSNIAITSKDQHNTGAISVIHNNTKT